MSLQKNLDIEIAVRIKAPNNILIAFNIVFNSKMNGISFI